MLYRDHRATLDDSMKTVTKLSGTTAHLVLHLNSVHANSLNQKITVNNVKVMPCRHNLRKGHWANTHIVTVDGLGVMGFTDGPLLG